MPSPPIAIAFLMFTAEMRRNGGVKDAPWSWPKWQARVGSQTAPWESPAEGETHIFGWSEEIICAVREYVDEFCKKPAGRRLTFGRIKQDDFTEERDLLQKELFKGWDDTWGVSSLIRTTLTAMGKGRADLLAEHGDRQVSVMSLHS